MVRYWKNSGGWDIRPNLYMEIRRQGKNGTQDRKNKVNKIKILKK